MAGRYLDSALKDETAVKETVTGGAFPTRLVQMKTSSQNKYFEDYSYTPIGNGNNQKHSNCFDAYSTSSQVHSFCYVKKFCITVNWHETMIVLCNRHPSFQQLIRPGYHIRSIFAMHGH
jgi:hypothetical protein